MAIEIAALHQIRTDAGLMKSSDFKDYA